MPTLYVRSGLVSRTVVWSVSDPIVEHAITAVLTGVTGFLSAGAKFVGDLRGLEDKIIKKIKDDVTDALIAKVTSLTGQVEELKRVNASNAQGWSLELTTIKGDLEDMQNNRGHGFASAVDYHSSEELVRRLEMAEADLSTMKKKAAEFEQAMVDRDTFDEFVREHNASARDLARTLGNIEGELKARFPKR